MLRAFRLPAVTAALLLTALPLAARTQEVPDRAPAPMDPPPMAFAGARGGTARGPAGSGAHHLMARRGPWTVLAHGFATLNGAWQDGPRGVDGAFVTSMFGAAARRPLGPGWLEVRGMASADPVMGRRGYPLLLQTGETADGVMPLVDRQHPHDLLVELAASFRWEVDPGAWAFVYAGPVGSPALGPVTFMHREASTGNPVAPLTHHFLDATHIAHGVVTAGLYVDGRIQIELSAFNGAEPDQDRWLPERPALDSFSGRVTFTPGARWALQASFADLTEPEQLHPAIDVYRGTVSATYARPLPAGTWAVTVAAGRNTRQETTMTLADARRRLSGPLLDHYLNLGSLPPDADDSLLLLFERRVQSALLAESSLQWGDNTAFARVEWARKDELFPPPDARHSRPFAVTKVAAGVVRRMASARWVEARAGVSGAVHALPDDLGDTYGGSPASASVFVTLALR